MREDTETLKITAWIENNTKKIKRNQGSCGNNRP